MDIVYAAEKTSIAQVLRAYTHRPVNPEDLRVSENPEETGSFFVGWLLDYYVLSPDGTIARDAL